MKLLKNELFRKKLGNPSFQRVDSLSNRVLFEIKIDFNPQIDNQLIIIIIE